MTVARHFLRSGGTKESTGAGSFSTCVYTSLSCSPPARFLRISLPANCSEHDSIEQRLGVCWTVFVTGDKVACAVSSGVPNTIVRCSFGPIYDLLHDPGRCQNANHDAVHRPLAAKGELSSSSDEVHTKLQQVCRVDELESVQAMKKIDLKIARGLIGPYLSPLLTFRNTYKSRGRRDERARVGKQRAFLRSSSAACTEAQEKQARHSED